MDFWELTKDVMKSKKMTQSVLAEKMGVSLKTVQGWFTRKPEPDRKVIIKLAEYLEVSPSYLLTGDVDNEFISAFSNLPETFKPIILNFIKELGDNFKKIGS